MTDLVLRYIMIWFMFCGMVLSSIGYFLHFIVLEYRSVLCLPLFCPQWNHPVWLHLPVLLWEEAPFLPICSRNRLFSKIPQNAELQTPYYNVVVTVVALDVHVHFSSCLWWKCQGLNYLVRYGWIFIYARAYILNKNAAGQKETCSDGRKSRTMIILASSAVFVSERWL